jgi:serine/threonine-protein kinase
MNARTAIRGSLPYVIAIVSGLLLAYLIVAFFVFPSGVIPRDARVPNVAGLSFDEATRRLAERGFRGQKGEERFHGGSPKGTVLEQNPPAGSHDVEGTVVTLVVSAGQQVAEVPRVVGLSREGAEAELEAAGFDIGGVVERPNPAPRGQVIESQPAPGTQAPIPSSVSLVVSAGASVVIVPNVVGHSVAEARRMLEGAQLAVGDVSASDGGNPESGVVASQSPPAGAQVATGARVTLLTRGPH